MAVKTGTVPPGGWHYEDAEHKTEGSGYPELVQAELTWRLQNQKVIGCVECDIEEFYRKNYPAFVTTSPTIQVTVTDIQRSHGAQLVDGIHEWAIGLYRNPMSQEMVSEQEALRRANICAMCSKNKEWKGGCHNCNENVERLLAMIRKGKDVGLSNQLQGCTALRHCNRTAVWMNKDLISKAETPNNCWMRQA